MEKYLITGAAGYIGSMLVRALCEKNSNIDITGLVRNPEKAKKVLPETVHLIVADITDDKAMAMSNRAAQDISSVELTDDEVMAISSRAAQLASADITDEAMTVLSADYDYIIHCAAVTKSAEMKVHPTEVADGIVHGTKNVLELARRCKENGHLKSMVYLSSMEVYGNIDCSDGHRVSEDEQGFVNPLVPRSCYPMGKRMAENLCASYYFEYGVPVKIARLAQTFGHGVSKEDPRVFAQFARAVVEGQNIILHTDGSSMGNYSAIEDTVSGILTLLYNGENGKAINIVNEDNTMRIRDMASLVASEIAGGRLQVSYDIPADNKYGYAANTGLMLSSMKLESLGWKPTKDLITMYRDMLEDWK